MNAAIAVDAEKIRPFGEAIQRDPLRVAHTRRAANVAAPGVIQGDVDIALTVLETDLIDPTVAPVGRIGLTVENIFRCLLLKQQLRVSYEQLAFHLSFCWF